MNRHRTPAPVPHRRAGAGSRRWSQEGGRSPGGRPPGGLSPFWVTRPSDATVGVSRPPSSHSVAGSPSAASTVARVDRRPPAPRSAAAEGPPRHPGRAADPAGPDPAEHRAPRHRHAGAGGGGRTRRADGAAAAPRPSWAGTSYGPRPGDPAGATVLAAHLDMPGYGTGPIAAIEDLRRGDAIVVRSAGTTTRYAVTRRSQHQQGASSTSGALRPGRCAGAARRHVRRRLRPRAAALRQQHRRHRDSGVVRGWLGWARARAR